MNFTNNVFSGTIPALMTPCSAAGEPNFEALVETGESLIAAGMRASFTADRWGQYLFLKQQWKLFRAWWTNWSGAKD